MGPLGTALRSGEVRRWSRVRVLARRVRPAFLDESGEPLPDDCLAQIEATAPEKVARLDWHNGQIEVLPTAARRQRRTLTCPGCARSPTSSTARFRRQRSDMTRINSSRYATVVDKAELDSMNRTWGQLQNATDDLGEIADSMGC